MHEKSDRKTQTNTQTEEKQYLIDWLVFNEHIITNAYALIVK